MVVVVTDVTDVVVAVTDVAVADVVVVVDVVHWSVLSPNFRIGLYPLPPLEMISTTESSLSERSLTKAASGVAYKNGAFSEPPIILTATPPEVC